MDESTDTTRNDAQAGNVAAPPAPENVNEPQVPAGLVTEAPGLQSGQRHIMRALDALRDGSVTQLHLHPDERAAVVAGPKHPNDGLHEIIRRLLAGETVNPPPAGTISEDDVQA